MIPSDPRPSTGENLIGSGGNESPVGDASRDSGPPATDFNFETIAADNHANMVRKKVKKGVFAPFLMGIWTIASLIYTFILPTITIWHLIPLLLSVLFLRDSRRLSREFDLLTSLSEADRKWKPKLIILRWIFLSIFVIWLLRIPVQFSNFVAMTSPSPNNNANSLIDGPVEWSRATSKAGGFSVLLPGRPIDSSIDSKDAQGNIVKFPLLSTVTRNKSIFTAVTLGPIRKSATDPFAVWSESLKQKGFLIQKRTKLDFEGNPGLELIATQKNKLTQMRLYQIKEIGYLLTIECLDSQFASEKANIEKFFSSFEPPL